MSNKIKKWEQEFIAIFQFLFSGERKLKPARLLYIFYLWLVIILGIWTLIILFPALDLDRGGELIVMLFLAILSGWLAVSLPRGQVSGGFAIILATFLVFGLAESAWVGGLATLLGQGIANRGNPLRTIVFNSCQNVLSVAGASYFYTLATDFHLSLVLANLLPVTGFTLAYFLINHFLIYLYLLPRKASERWKEWVEMLHGDCLSYLFTTPFGVVVAMIYSKMGLSGTTPIFVLLLAFLFIFSLYLRLKVISHELTAFYEISKKLGISLELEKILEMVLKKTRQIVSYHTGIIFLRSENGEAFLPVAVTGPQAGDIKRSMVAYEGEGIVGWVIINRRPEIIDDTRTDPRLINQAGLPQLHRSLLLIPLLFSGEVLGVFVLGQKMPMAFNNKHLHFLSIILRQVAVVISNVRLFKQVERIAVIDSLTGLYNHRYFYRRAFDEYKLHLNTGQEMALIIANVDQFKKINLKYGYSAGDIVLVKLAGLLRSCLRQDDLMARGGGDEFFILLSRTREQEAVEVMQRIYNEVYYYVFVIDEEQKAHVTISMGMSIFPRDASDLEELFRKAGQALDLAKKRRVSIN